MNINDEVIVLHSSRKDIITAVVKTEYGTQYRISSNTLYYRKAELKLLKEFNGAVRSEPPRRLFEKSRYPCCAVLYQNLKYLKSKNQNPDF